MATEYKVSEMAAKIEEIRKLADELDSMCGGIQAVKKNIVRLLSSTKMLELNVSDIKDLV
jgi:Na+/H+-translocating membrane pyrophosphatase